MSFCACSRFYDIEYTRLFAGHDPLYTLKYLADANGYESGNSASGDSSGSSFGEKYCTYEIKGDEAIREEILREYKMMIEKEAEMYGLDVTSKENDPFTGFHLTYDNHHGIRGTFRLFAIVDWKGIIQFDAILYEHKNG